MRIRTRGPKVILVTMLAVLLAPAASSMAARAPGSIRLERSIAETAYADAVPFTWNFLPGTKVRTYSQVYLQVTNDGYRWRSIASRLPIRSGGFSWNTVGWPEGMYYARVIVHNTLITSSVGPLVLDRTAPRSRITHPSEGSVTVEDLAQVNGSVVIGTTTLEAEVSDNGSGVESIDWSLDDTPIGSGTPLEYNFSMQPGKHTLTVETTDIAGNSSSHSVQVIAGPGPSLVVENIPAEELPPIEEPSIPEEPPTLPEDLPGLPDDLPGLPDGFPGFPEGFPGLPEGAPGLPDGVPTAPGVPSPEAPPVERPTPPSLPAP